MTPLHAIQDILALLAEGKHLSEEQAARAFQIVMNGGATPAQIGALLMGLRSKGETAEEITGGALALRAKMQKIKAPEGVIDVCGTGGDAKGTLNVSTAVGLVVAACGVKVAKHGNRAVSSASGSADVLKELGVNIEAEPPVIEKCLRECGFGFMLAPRFHPAMRHVAPVRLELGMRTIFNLLGPLANPAEPPYQLLGVYSADWVEPMAQVLQKLGVKRAWVVHGSDGMDELTLTGPSHVAELADGKVRLFDVTPEDAGLERASIEELKGKDAAHNAQKLREVLMGIGSAYQRIVALNAGAALAVAGRAEDIKEGVALAMEAIASGQAYRTLQMLTTLSNER